MATHSSVLAWKIPGTGEPDGLLSMGSHRVEHDWSDLAAAAATGLGSLLSMSSWAGGSVARSCLTLCDPMDCSIPIFPVRHCLPELVQTHVHWVGDGYINGKGLVDFYQKSRCTFPYFLSLGPWCFVLFLPRVRDWEPSTGHIYYPVWRSWLYSRSTHSKQEDKSCLSLNPLRASLSLAKMIICVGYET